MKRRSWIIIAVIVAAIAGFFVWKCAQPAAAVVDPFKTVTIEKGDLTEEITANGIINPVRVVSRRHPGFGHRPGALCRFQRSGDGRAIAAAARSGAVHIAVAGERGGPRQRPRQCGVAGGQCQARRATGETGLHQPAGVRNRTSLRPQHGGAGGTGGSADPAGPRQSGVQRHPLAGVGRRHQPPDRYRPDGGGQLQHPDAVPDRTRSDPDADRSLGGRSRYRQGEDRPGGGFHRRCLWRAAVSRHGRSGAVEPDDPAECRHLYRDRQGSEPRWRIAAGDDRQRQFRRFGAQQCAARSQCGAQLQARRL